MFCFRDNGESLIINKYSLFEYSRRINKFFKSKKKSKSIHYLDEFGNWMSDKICFVSELSWEMGTKFKVNKLGKFNTRNKTKTWVYVKCKLYTDWSDSQASSF